LNSGEEKRMDKFRTVRGMRDFLPEEARLMRYIEDRARRVSQLYGYNEVVTPAVESYELLSAKAGEEVKSRMFVFQDLGGRSVALRPEFTAPVARLVVSTMRTQPKPFRIFSVGTVYRYDEPQKGRYREFWQSDYELIGSNKPAADAEIILLTNSLMRAAGLKNVAFKVGHVGVLRGIFNAEKIGEKVQNETMQLMDKKQYDDALRALENAGISAKGLKVLRKLIEIKGQVNPTGDRESKDKLEQKADPVEMIKDAVAEYNEAVKSAGNLREILELVKESGRGIKLTVDAGFARGLEYYTGVIFEVYSSDLDMALGGGGRYDKLIELFGGEPTPATGVAHGLDRIMLRLQMQKATPEREQKKHVVIVPISEELNGKALKVAEILREANLNVEVDVMGRKIVKALEDADRKKSDYAVILGERELRENAVVVRNLAKREQETVKIEELADKLKEK
jgi:histidyl-tRNA synthetase